MLNAKRRAVPDSDFVFAITFFLSTSSIEIICVFCFSRKSSISFRKVFEIVGLVALGVVCWVVGACGVLKIGSIFLGSSCFSSEANAYFHIILSWDLNGIAKSLMFLRATRIDGSSFSSVRILFSFSFRYASFSIDFRFSVWPSSFCSWPGMR